LMRANPYPIHCPFCDDVIGVLDPDDWTRVGPHQRLRNIHDSFRVHFKGGHHIAEDRIDAVLDLARWWMASNKVNI